MKGREEAPEGAQQHSIIYPMGLSSSASSRTLLSTSSVSLNSTVQEDITELPKVRAPLPRGVWVIAAIAFFERVAYNAVTGPFQNYIQNKPDDPLHPGALGLGQSNATIMVSAFLFLSYALPLAGSIVADIHLGPYKTIFISYAIYATGVAIIFVTSFPVIFSKGAGLPGLAAAMAIIATGLGCMRAAIPPYMAQQCSEITEKVITTSKGERQFVSQDLTREYAFNLYVWGSNVGTLSRIAATSLEKYVHFWAAYLLSLVAICLGLLVLATCRKHLLTRKPEGKRSLLTWTRRAFKIAMQNGFKMDSARPEAVLAREQKVVEWSNGFITELKSGLLACRVFLPFIVYWLCQNQLTTNIISQASDLKTDGIPNDVLPNMNSLTICIVMPILNHCIYPYMKRRNISFPPIWRITLGFFLEALATGWAAGVQAMIYAAAPCFEYPRACSASANGSTPNNVHIWFQLPVYILQGLAEVFAVTAVYEYSYAKAPQGMKNTITALFVTSAAAGSAISLSLKPTYKDPNLLYMYAAVAGAMFVTTVVFPIIFRKQDRKDQEERECQDAGEERKHYQDDRR